MVDPERYAKWASLSRTPEAANEAILHSLRY